MYQPCRAILRPVPCSIPGRICMRQKDLPYALCCSHHHAVCREARKWAADSLGILQGICDHEHVLGRGFGRPRAAQRGLVLPWSPEPLHGGKCQHLLAIVQDYLQMMERNGNPETDCIWMRGAAKPERGGIPQSTAHKGCIAQRTSPMQAACRPM